MSYMITYQCNNCEESFEIEAVEAYFGPHEHYEHSLCKPCFIKGNEHGYGICHHCLKVDKVGRMVSPEEGMFAHQACIDLEENPRPRLR